MACALRDLARAQPLPVQDPDLHRPLRQQDDADIRTPEGRGAYTGYWRERHERLRPHVADLGERDLLAWQRMRTFHHEVGDILATLADTVQPRRFDDFLRWGFADPPP